MEQPMRSQRRSHFVVAAITASAQMTLGRGSAACSSQVEEDAVLGWALGPPALPALPNLLATVEAVSQQISSPAANPVSQTSKSADSQQQQPQQQPQQQQQQQPKRPRANPPWLHKLATQHSNRNRLVQVHQPDETQGQPVCVEVTHSRKRVYRVREGQDGWQGWDMVEATQYMQNRLLNLFKSYFLPQGFPNSVAPQYASYMWWRGVQYAFGGAISVFTTKSLLGALGVAGKYSGEAAAAINWVIKDGAGRLGRLLFARWGRELDCELKQFRLVGDLLMEGGAALELATIWAPKAFLPLACTANLAKNLAAVAASATRAPIYRTFALQNNMADITAKGESVANLADIMGTMAGIMLSKSQLPLLPTFCVLSAGYLLASRKEVDAVELPTLNRARLEYVAREFLMRGQVPSIPEANHQEPVLPWNGFNAGRVVLGSTLEAACRTPQELRVALANCHSSARHVLCYRPDQGQVHILLKEGADGLDCLRAVFSAHVFLYHLAGHPLSSKLPSSPASGKHSAKGLHTASGKGTHQGGAAGLQQGQQQQLHPEWVPVMAQSAQLVTALFPVFVKQAEAQGWKLNQTALNPRDTRLLHVTTPLSV